MWKNDTLEIEDIDNYTNEKVIINEDDEVGNFVYNIKRTIWRFIWFNVKDRKTLEQEERSKNYVKKIMECCNKW